MTCPTFNPIVNPVMEINKLIKKLNELKAAGVKRIDVIDDNWNDFELDVASPKEAGMDSPSVGYLVVHPLAVQD